MSNQIYLIKQDFKIAIHNLLRFKTQAYIALFGLAFALSCFVPALYWIYYETTYDSFYPNAELIYRVVLQEKQSGKVNERVPGILGKELVKQFPEIEFSSDFISEQLDYNDIEKTNYIQLNTICADTAFLRVFPQRSIIGDVDQALQVPGNMALTESVAIRLFGSAEKAIGQKLENQLSRIFGPCTVIAVVKNTELNTNLPFDALLNYPALQDASMIMPESEQWNYFNNNLYVKVHSHIDIDRLAMQLRDFTSQKKVNPDIELKILPISKVRHGLSSNLLFTLNFIRLMVTAGALLMFSALFNFLNLFIGLFRERTHEFRQRIIYGATNNRLILQMMFEQTAFASIALLLGGYLIFLFMPSLANLLNIPVNTPLLLRFFIFSSLSVILCLIFMSIVPYWNLIRVVKSDLSIKKTSKQTSLQRIALSLQLAVCIVFIVSVSVIMIQIHYVSRKDLGFNLNGVIQLYSTNAKLENDKPALMQKLESMPKIVNITTTSFEPRQNPQMNLMTSEVEWPQKDVSYKPVFQWIPVGVNFAETFGLELSKGRWWMENEKNKIVINEEAVRIMRLDNPIGTIIRMSPFLISSDGMASMEEYEIVGVVKNFHSLSFRNPIYPSILRPGMEDIWYVRVAPGQEQEVIHQINSILQDIDPRLTDCRLTTLKELYERLNYSERVGLKLFSILAMVSLFISIFGIYAVTTTATLRRRKEIAIRKITGAQTEDIVNMFLNEYMKLVFVANLIALPLAYYVMQRWLQGYAYHVDIPLWLLGVIFGGITSIVLFTVLLQVWRAANGNLSEVIKNE